MTGQENYGKYAKKQGVLDMSCLTKNLFLFSPAFNTGPAIEANFQQFLRLDRILRAEGCELRLRIIDDCSKDGATREILARLATPALFSAARGNFFPPNSLPAAFWAGTAAAVATNCIATYFLYKALDLAELSYLMPYMTLTSLTIIIPPMILFG